MGHIRTTHLCLGYEVCLGMVVVHAAIRKVIASGRLHLELTMQLVQRLLRDVHFSVMIARVHGSVQMTFILPSDGGV